VVPAVFMLGQLVGDYYLGPVADPGPLPSPLRLLVVTIFQKIGIHQPGVERHLSGM
jgi:hypothetical protein